MALDPILLRLAEVRRAFDATFAAPARSFEKERRSVLAIRAGEGRFAIRVEDLSGVEACRKIVKVPGSLPGLLGLTGLRGRLLAVYDLGAMLGQPSLDARAGSRELRWMLVCGKDSGIGLLIEEIEAFVRIADADLKPIEPGVAGEHIRAMLQQGSSIRGVVDIASIAAAVARRAEESLDGRRQ